MNALRYLQYRFEKTSASKAQKRRAASVIADLGTIQGVKKRGFSLSRAEADRLARAKMVQERQNISDTIRRNLRLVRIYEAANRKNSGYGEYIANAKAEIKRARKRGKQIGDAKRAGKITVPFVVDAPTKKPQTGLKTLEPNIKGSGLTSKLQPTTRFPKTKQRVADTIKNLFTRTLKR